MSQLDFYNDPNYETKFENGARTRQMCRRFNRNYNGKRVFRVLSRKAWNLRLQLKKDAIQREPPQRFLDFMGMIVGVVFAVNDNNEWRNNKNKFNPAGGRWIDYMEIQRLGYNRKVGTESFSRKQVKMYTKALRESGYTRHDIDFDPINCKKYICMYLNIEKIICDFDPVAAAQDEGIDPAPVSPGEREKIKKMEAERRRARGVGIVRIERRHRPKQATSVGPSRVDNSHTIYTAEQLSDSGDSKSSLQQLVTDTEGYEKKENTSLAFGAAGISLFLSDKIGVPESTAGATYRGNAQTSPQMDSILLSPADPALQDPGREEALLQEGDFDFQMLTRTIKDAFPKETLLRTHIKRIRFLNFTNLLRERLTARLKTAIF